MIRMTVLVSIALLSGACAATVSSEDHIKATTRYDLAIASLNQGDTRAALRELTVAIEIDPNLAEGHNALGLVYHGLGRLDAALDHYREAVQKKPTFSEAYNNMGALLIDLGRFDDAIEAFKVALADILYATPSLAEGNLGWAYYKRGDIDLGLKHIRNATAQNPKFCRGYEWLAKIGIDRSEPDLVVSSVRRFEKHCLDDGSIAKTLRPEYLREMRYYLAMGYLKKGDQDAARKTLASCATADEGEFGNKCIQSLHTLQ